MLGLFCWSDVSDNNKGLTIHYGPYNTLYAINYSNGCAPYYACADICEFTPIFKLFLYISSLSQNIQARITKIREHMYIQYVYS